MIKLTTDIFVIRSATIHNNRYDYTKTLYINAKTKVCIICLKHGEFWQEPKHHLSGVGCPFCAKTKKLDVTKFIKKAFIIHGRKYDYSGVTYVNNHTKISIGCPVHGEFWQEPSSHLNGSGCPKCAKNGVLLDIEEFIKKARISHGDYFDYSKVNYTNAKTKVCIICPRHGEFWQAASSHLSGKGCPKCKSSKLENIVLTGLNKNHISNIFQFKLKNLGKKTIDFYLPKYKIAIECQGEQHYVPTMFGNMTKEEANDNLFKRQILDQEKYISCLKEKIELVYFTNLSYFREKNIDVKIGFYKDKKVFTDINNLINYIQNQNKLYYSNTFDQFYNTILSLNTNIKCIGDVFLYKNNCVIFNKRTSHDKLVKMTKYYKKLKYNVLNVFEDEFILHKDVILNKIKLVFKIDIT